jgi:hypothetical protein
LKLWLLDADILIDFLSHDLLDKLVKSHEIHAASSVIDEVKFFKRGGEKCSISFHRDRFSFSHLQSNKILSGKIFIP